MPMHEPEVLAANTRMFSVSKSAKVYVAGPVIEHAEEDGELGRVLPWREEILGLNRNSGAQGYLEANEYSIGRFIYAGPTIYGAHGVGEEELPQRCLREVAEADIFFAWVDREDVIGVLVELGFAHACGKPIFIAFANSKLRDKFYFASKLAGVSIVARDAVKAWKRFTKWRDREDSLLGRKVA